MLPPAFQSSRSLRTATLADVTGERQEEISILAVLADRDNNLSGGFPAALYFNPRGPCGPRLSTGSGEKYIKDFNPRGPCGPRHGRQHQPGDPAAISILAVLADRDCFWRRDIEPKGAFQSSRSLRTATVRGLHKEVCGRISILAVLADRDGHDSVLKIANRNFNPRGPCGPRRGHDFRRDTRDAISILAVLADRDIKPGTDFHRKFHISILAVLADRDPRLASSRQVRRHFNPRGPCGPRLGPCLLISASRPYFNPRGPCGPRHTTQNKHQD